MVVKILYSTGISYLPTQLNVMFCGSPDGQVYVVFGRFYKDSLNRRRIEYVIARHQEFRYNYNTETIFYSFGTVLNQPVQKELLDKTNPSIEIIKIHRDVHSLYAAVKKFDESITNNNMDLYEIRSIDCYTNCAV
jgi:hypothetical protein